MNNSKSTKPVADEDNSSIKPRSRRWLRLFFFFMIISCLILGFLSRQVPKKNRAIKHIEELGGSLQYHNSLNNTGIKWFDDILFDTGITIFLAKNFFGARYISIESTHITNEVLNEILVFKSLEFLLIPNTRTTDLKPLSKLLKLGYLVLSNNQISNLTPLSKLTQLRSLILYNNNVNDLSPLANLSNLRGLDLSQNQITDITSLAGLTRLTDLSISNNQITNLPSLSKLKKLTSLNLADNQINDISNMQGLTSLMKLDVSNNSITDLSPLSGLVNLSVLNIANNPDLTVAEIDKLQKALPKCNIFHYAKK